MNDIVLPEGMVEVRRTPTFSRESVPAALLRDHRTSVWAELNVVSGSVVFRELVGETPRVLNLGPGQTAVILPDVTHLVEPSDDAGFFVRFFRPAE